LTCWKNQRHRHCCTDYDYEILIDIHIGVDIRVSTADALQQVNALAVKVDASAAGWLGLRHEKIVDIGANQITRFYG
jgi:hypothetical protein